jgi:hypothetical protein
MEEGENAGKWYNMVWGFLCLPEWILKSGLKSNGT